VVAVMFSFVSISEVIGWEGWLGVLHSQEIGWEDRLQNDL